MMRLGMWYLERASASLIRTPERSDLNMVMRKYLTNPK